MENYTYSASTRHTSIDSGHLMDRLLSVSVGMSKSIADKTIQLIEILSASDGNCGMVLLTSTGKILWVNKVHARTFGDGTGKTCYDYYNKFSDKCKWCRIDAAIANRAIQTSRAVSPSPDRCYLSYSDLVFIPLTDIPAEPPRFVLEVIKYTTPTEHRLSHITVEKYIVLARVAATLRNTSNTKTLYDLLLIGSLLSLHFSIRSTQLYVLQKKSKHYSVELGLELKRGVGFADMLEIINAGSSTNPVEASVLTQKCGGDIHDITNQALTSDLDAFLSNKESERGIPFRVGDSFKQAGLLLSTKIDDKNILIFVDQENRDDFVRDEDLANLLLFGAFVSQAFSLRELSKRLNSEEAVLVRKLEATGEDVRKEICGMFSIQLSHEIIRHTKILRSTLPIRCINPLLPVTIDGDLLRELLSELDALDRSVARMDTLVTASAPMKVQKIYITQFLREKLDQFERRFNDARIKATLNSPDPPNFILNADIDKLGIVVENFVDNAIKVLKIQKGRKRIELGCNISETSVRVWCVDNGPGVPPENANNIWRAFFTTTIGGKGHGLPLARRLMREHGGDAILEQPHQGLTRFVAVFPRYLDDKPTE